MKRILLAAAAAAVMLVHPASAQRANYEQMVASHAAANGVPADLVHRVIVRESRYNPRAVSKGNYGMMQIKLATARGLGYTGTAQGLLDPDTNLTYAVKYLAGAYRVANGDHNRAVSYYAGGYYYAAKRQGMLPRQQAQTGRSIILYDANAQEIPQRNRHHRH
jgi:soluble lytic murein transglycosylase-like protein